MTLPIGDASEMPLWAVIFELPRVGARARRLVSSPVTWTLFAVVFLLGVLIGPRDIHCCGGGKVDLANLVVTKYANEAFPQWALDHPDRTCPMWMVELDVYMDKPSHLDPWGHAYRPTCSSGKLVVRSLGEDGRDGTADDIRSDR